MNMQNHQTFTPTNAKEIDIFAGAALRKHRIAAGFSLQEIGDKVGLSYQQVQKYERASNRISLGKAQQFAQILNIDVTEFFPSHENRNDDGVDVRVLRLMKPLSNLPEKSFKAVQGLVKTLAA